MLVLGRVHPTLNFGWSAFRSQDQSWNSSSYRPWGLGWTPAPEASAALPVMGGPTWSGSNCSPLDCTSSSAIWLPPRWKWRIETQPKSLKTDWCQTTVGSVANWSARLVFSKVAPSKPQRFRATDDITLVPMTSRTKTYLYKWWIFIGIYYISM